MLLLRRKRKNRIQKTLLFVISPWIVALGSAAPDVQGIETADAPISPPPVPSLVEVGLSLAQWTTTGYTEGAAVGDVNGDGILDVFFSNKAGDENELWFGQGGLRFQKIDSPPDSPSGRTPILVDIDADRDLDLFLANASSSTNRFLVNDGDGCFTDRTSESGLISSRAAHGVAVADVDGDGDLDMHVGNAYSDPDHLYINGHLWFIDQADVRGVADTCDTHGVAFGDLDNDGDQDLCLANYGGGCRIYANRGDGYFTDITPSPARSLQWGHGVALGDIENDGDLDVYFTSSTANILLINQGQNAFEEGTAASGVDGGGDSLGCAFADLDNDGDLDLLVVNNHGGTNRLYINDGTGVFSEEGARAGFNDAGNALALVTADLDDDGDLDIVVGRWGANGQNLLYRNDLSAGHYLKIIPRDPRSMNRDCIGARVSLYENHLAGDPAARLGMREIHAGGGFMSCEPPVAHFGVPTSERVSVVVWFPAGQTVTLDDIEPDQTLIVALEPPPAPTSTVSPTPTDTPEVDPGPYEWQVVLQADQAWEHGHASLPWVIYEEGQYRMWYTVADVEPKQCWFGGGIAYAESADGVTWSGKSLQIASSDSNGPQRLVWEPVVLKVNGEYRLYCNQHYTWSSGEWSAYVVMRTSSNGLHWSAPTTVLDGNGKQPWEVYEFWNKSVYPEPGGGFRLFYAVKFTKEWSPYPYAYMATASSPDGIHWGERSQMLGDGGTPLYASYIGINTLIDQRQDGSYRWLYVNRDTKQLTVAESEDGVNWSGISDGYHDVAYLHEALIDPPTGAFGGCILRTPDRGEYLYFTVGYAYNDSHSIGCIVLREPGSVLPTPTPTPTASPSLSAYYYLVSSDLTDSVLRYDAGTGEFVDEFASGAGLETPRGFDFGPDGNLYVSNAQADKNILRFDGNTGEYIDVFIENESYGPDSPHALIFGPDGNLYVGNTHHDNVLKYDGRTGAYLGVFASGGGLNIPIGMEFGPGGNLYVCSIQSDQVLLYDGTTGAFLGVFASGNGLDAPSSVVFGPDGNLYVSSGLSDEVLRFDGRSGDFIDRFVTAGSGGLHEVGGLLFGPDGNLYVCSARTDQVLRYNGQTGDFIDVFLSHSLLGWITYPKFVPKDQFEEPRPTPTPVQTPEVPLVRVDDLVVSSLASAQVLVCDGTSGALRAAVSSGGELEEPNGVTVGPDGNLYVACSASHRVLRYDGATGEFLDVFVPAGSGGLGIACGVLFGPDGDLYVSSWRANNVIRYDGQTGAFERVIASGSQVKGPTYMAFGPDGHLYFANFTANNVLKYDVETGTYLGVFVSKGSGGLQGPTGVTFGSDGNFYVSSRRSDEVLRYDGGTGAFIDDFVPAGSGGLSIPRGLAFGPDGNLYVSSASSDEVLRFNGMTGEFISAFVPEGTGGLDKPYGLAFRSLPIPSPTATPSPTAKPTATATPDARFHLLVSSRLTDSVLRYNGATGAFLDQFTRGGNLNGPRGTALGPDGNLYVSSLPGDRVFRFDGDSGNFIDTFVASGDGGLDGPEALLFTVGGDLLVSSVWSDKILRFDGTTGAFVEAFSSRGELDGPNGMAFGPDGYLYVCSEYNHKILRYSVSTGELIDVFVPQGNHLSYPRGLAFGPDSHLYVCNREEDNIVRFDGHTGAYMDTFIAAGSGGLDGPWGVDFGPDGNLYVCSENTNSVLRYNGQTGEFIDLFVAPRSGGLDKPTYLLFVPPRLNVNITAHLEPALPRTLDDLECVTTLDNLGGYPELTWSYRWFRDNEELTEGTEFNGVYYMVNGATLSHHFTSKNETFFCGALVTDGTAWLETFTEPVTILNTTPTAPIVRILPEHPTAFNGLAVWIVQPSVDPDEEDYVAYLFEWFESSDGATWTRRPELSGYRDPFFPGEPEISSLYIQVGEYWRVDVTPIELGLPGGTALSKAISSGSLLEVGAEGEKGTYSVFVLPDLDDDGDVDQDDLCVLLSVWHKSKIELSGDLRTLFFESTEADDEQIGVVELFKLSQQGWYRSNED